MHCSLSVGSEVRCSASRPAPAAVLTVVLQVLQNKKYNEKIDVYAFGAPSPAAETVAGFGS